MTDRLPKKRRSWLMSRVRSKDTTPEKAVRSLGGALGYRYRLHTKTLPGKPDLVFRSRRRIIFVHGCFWHGHKGCNKGHLPKSNKRYWHNKIVVNQARDARITAE